MPFRDRGIHHPLVQRLQSTGYLSDESESAIRSLPVRLARIPSRTDIVTAEEPAEETFFIIDGMATGYKSDGEGRRQIVSVHVRGDMPDLMTLFLPRVDTAISAVGECHIARIMQRDVRELCRGNAEVRDSLWRLTLIDAAVVREWVRNVGSRDGMERMAHLLCEIVVRKEEVGIGSRSSCPLELNQVELADATGMTPVHANRTLQELRRRALIRLGHRTLVVLDWDRLVALAGFSAEYLYLRIR